MYLYLSLSLSFYLSFSLQVFCQVVSPHLSDQGSQRSKGSRPQSLRSLCMSKSKRSLHSVSQGSPTEKVAGSIRALLNFFGYYTLLMDNLLITMIKNAIQIVKAHNWCQSSPECDDIFEYSNISDPNIYSDIRLYQNFDTYIFRYSLGSKKFIQIYSDISSCHFLDTNIFGYSFV